MGQDGMQFVEHRFSPAGRNAACHQGDRPAQCISGFAHRFDGLFHFLSSGGQRTAGGRSINDCSVEPLASSVHGNVTDAVNVAGDGHAQGCEPLSGDGTAHDTSSRFSGAGPTSAPVVSVAKLRVVREVGVRRAKRMLEMIVIRGLRVRVADDKSDRCAGGLAFVNARKTFHDIGFAAGGGEPGLAWTPSVHICLNLRPIHFQPCWNALQNSAQSWPMAFAEGRQTHQFTKRIRCHARKLRRLTFAGMPILIKDIRGLIGAWETPPAYVAGHEMAEIPVLENAWLAIDNGVIADWGTMDDFPGIVDWRDLEVVDGSGRFVWPAWCDSHTHLVFARDRAGEFMDRLDGLTYQEIAARGGGILNSARALQETSEEQLLADAEDRLLAVQQQGTGAIEIKSGYGLSIESELKMLRVIRALSAKVDVPIRSTFLAAHAVPEGMSASTWTSHAILDILPEVRREKLADYIDVFCEEGYFGLTETKSILEAGQAAGFAGKLHVNQFTAMGGVALGVAHGALSVDHLEEMTPEDLAALQGAFQAGQVTFPTALPGCSHFLGIPYTPGRALIDGGLPLVLATDFNPGSAPSGNMTLAVQLAIVKMRLRPLEAIAAATINGAAAMGLSDVAGAIAVGRAANIILSRPMGDLVEIGYHFGSDPVENVLINGRWMRH